MKKKTVREKLNLLIPSNSKRSQLLDSGEVVRRFGVSKVTLRKWIQSDRLHPLPRSGRAGSSLFFKREEIEKLSRTRPKTGFRRGPKPKPKEEI